MSEDNGNQIDATGLWNLISTGTDVELIDVREAWEIEICHIAHSRSIPLSELQQRAGELPREKPMVMVCHHGMRSYHATLWLRQSSFDNALNLKGGIDAWAREIEPGMARY